MTYISKGDFQRVKVLNNLQNKLEALKETSAPGKKSPVLDGIDNEIKTLTESFGVSSITLHRIVNWDWANDVESKKSLLPSPLAGGAIFKSSLSRGKTRDCDNGTIIIKRSPIYRVLCERHTRRKFINLKKAKWYLDEHRGQYTFADECKTRLVLRLPSDRKKTSNVA